MRSSLAALFPGQGSQYVGMNKDLLEHFPWTKAYYEEASDAIKIDLLKLCLDGDASQLQLTANAQPAILVTSYAWYQVLVRNLDFNPKAAAGHSLGEYSALLASEVLSLESAVRLVRKRGELMQDAVPVGKGKMAALIGLTDEQVEELCKVSSDGETSMVVPANFNAPSQVVVAGHSDAVDRLMNFANGTDPTHPNLKAKKVVALQVSAPFHCPLMKPVAEKFRAYLSAETWGMEKFPVASNVTGTLRPSDSYVERLVQQLDHSVRWVACVKSLEADGCELFVEMGPGRVLTGLAKRILEKGKPMMVDSLEDLKELEKVLTRS